MAQRKHRSSDLLSLCNVGLNCIGCAVLFQAAIQMMPETFISLHSISGVLRGLWQILKEICLIGSCCAFVQGWIQRVELKRETEYLQGELARREPRAASSAKFE